MNLLTSVVLTVLGILGLVIGLVLMVLGGVLLVEILRPGVLEEWNRLKAEEEKANRDQLCVHCRQRRLKLKADRERKQRAP